MTLDEYLERYARRDLFVIKPNPDTAGDWPTVVVKYGDYALVLHLAALAESDPHVFVDAHAFVNDERARVGVFGMEEGRAYLLEGTQRTSHNWPATMGVTLLVGRQGWTGER